MAYRLRDILLSLIFLSCFSWLFVLIIFILFLSQKKIFFIQERSGLHGKAFQLIKFSTLRDILPGEKEEENQQARLTKGGKFLRKFSLDELPQLYNVLKGEMSLVGPRPLLSEYLPLYIDTEKRRFEIKPGITGWAQINGRNAITFKQRFELDVWYVDHRSMILDFKILFKTIGRSVSGAGVYIDKRTTAHKYDGTN